MKALQAKADKPGVKSGSFGYVVDTPNDPGTVTKTAFDSDAHHAGSKYKFDKVIDAYYIWIRMCAKHSRMAQNPFLPRVYVVDEREDDTGQRVPRYQMEKMYAPNTEMINSDMLMGMAEQLGVSKDRLDNALVEVRSDILNHEQYFGTPMPEERKEKEMKREIWGEIIRALGRNQFEFVNKELQQALALVEHIISTWPQESGRIWEDMHSGNFMIRITNVGPQLVFTDPIAGEVPYSAVEQYLDGQ